MSRRQSSASAQDQAPRPAPARHQPAPRQLPRRSAWGCRAHLRHLRVAEVRAYFGALPATPARAGGSMSWGDEDRSESVCVATAADESSVWSRVSLPNPIA